TRFSYCLTRPSSCVMLFPSVLLRRLLAERTQKWRYWSLVDRIAALTHPSTDLSSALTSAAEELGRSLNLVHCAVLLHSNLGLRVGGTYSAKTFDAAGRDKLRMLD